MRLTGLALLLLLCGQSAQSALLDKIVGTFNDKIITLSQIQRMKKTIKARGNISPNIFKRSNYSHRELVELSIQKFLIREKLSQIGHIIDNPQVDGHIKMVERQNGLNRKTLLAFLKKNGLNFDEYFELVRESIEYNLFATKIISPLISVTDQDVKNAFYKENMKDKTLSFRYSLVDFSLERHLVDKKMLKQFQSVLKKFQSNGTLPKKFSKLETTVIGDLTEENLTKQIKEELKKTNEGSFSSPVLIGDDYHVFFVKKKDLIESEIFTKVKKKFRQALMQKSEERMIQDWVKREKSSHHVKLFI